jgi:hypothetical protein
MTKQGFLMQEASAGAIGEDHVFNAVVRTM